jgi:hypothetical protein
MDRRQTDRTAHETALDGPAGSGVCAIAVVTSVSIKIALKPPDACRFITGSPRAASGRNQSRLGLRSDPVGTESQPTRCAPHERLWNSRRSCRTPVNSSSGIDRPYVFREQSHEMAASQHGCATAILRASELVFRRRRRTGRSATMRLGARLLHWSGIVMVASCALFGSVGRSLAAEDALALDWQRLPDLPNEIGVAGPFVGVHQRSVDRRRRGEFRTTGLGERKTLARRDPRPDKIRQ